jgi:hypothetical protein
LRPTIYLGRKMCKMFIFPWRNPLGPKFAIQIVLTPGVIEKDIARMDKMQEKNLAFTFEDQQSNVNAWC